MRRVALYARVSSPHQEKEETIESQLEQLRTFATQRGYDIPPDREFIDKAVSGEHLIRPALDRLRDAAAMGSFDLLLCLHVDRLARNLGALYVVLNELEHAGVQVVFLNQPDLDKSPQAKLLVNIQGLFAEYERVHIQERMRRGRMYRYRHGQSLPAPAPYGYRFQSATPSQPSQWVIIPENAAIVQRIFTWYNEDKLNLRQIAAKLNEQHTPSPQGKRWLVNVLGRLLRNSAYAGTAYYARSQIDHTSVGQPRCHGRGVRQTPRFTPRPVEQWIALHVPPLVDDGTWQTAQERLEMNARFARRNSQHTYVLRGLIVCGTCHHTLQGQMRHGVLYYACRNGGRNRPPDLPQHTCSVRGDVVEPLIWQALADLLRQPEQITTAWQALQAEQATIPSEIEQWRQRQTHLRKQQQRLLDAYQVGAVTLADLIQRKNPLDLEIQELQKKLDHAGHVQQTVPSLDVFTQQIERALNAPDVATKQEVLRLLIERIVVTDEALTVEHIIPTVNKYQLRPTRPVLECVGSLLRFANSFTLKVNSYKTKGS